MQESISIPGCQVCVPASDGYYYGGGQTQVNRRLNLKLFDGFSRDMAADLTDLRPGEVEWLRTQGIVEPQKNKGGYYLYDFTDLLVLRLVRQLKLNDIPVKNIKKAKQYLATFDPNCSLTAVNLFVRRESGRIMYIGEDPQPDVKVDMTQGGQLVRTDVCCVVPVGKALERVRKEVIGMDRTLAQRVKSKKFVSADDVYRQYGLC